jgi:hypothetical protein
VEEDEGRVVVVVLPGREELAVTAAAGGGERGGHQRGGDDAGPDCGGAGCPWISVNSSRCSRQDKNTMVYPFWIEIHWQQATVR